MVCFLEVNGAVHAVLNWRSRVGKDDVIIGCLLNAVQSAAYRRMKAQGMAEGDICDAIFPPPPLPPSRQTLVSIDVALLTKAQLLRCIRERLNQPLNSLHKLCVEDLRSILGSMAGG